jgi:hypothetical protein
VTVNEQRRSANKKRHSKPSSLRDIFRLSGKHSSIPAIKLGESDSSNQVEDGQSGEDEP